MNRFASILLALAIVACSSRETTTPDAAVPPDAPIVDACTTEGATRCTGLGLDRCASGIWTRSETCTVLCDDALGCIDCRPDEPRTCLDDEVRACTDRGTIGAVIETCADDAPCSAGYCGGCAADTDLIYLLDAGSHLVSFDPRDLELEDRGAIDCAGEGATGSPYSMAVDQRGHAWVLYDDGRLFLVDIADASCEATDFEPDQGDLHTFGMGFSSLSPGGAETLFVAGGPSLESAETDTQLAAIDTHTLELRVIAPVTTLGTYFPELTGDGAGGLYGFFPSTELPSRVSTLRAESGRIGPTWDAIELDEGERVSAWAFARWGGAFYLSVAIADPRNPAPFGSEIFRLDPASGEVTFLRNDFRTFVGAGVSTCAPLVF